MTERKQPGRVLDGQVFAVGVVLALGFGIYGAVWVAGRVMTYPVSGFDEYMVVFSRFWWVVGLIVLVILGAGAGVYFWLRSVTAQRRLRTYYQNKRGMRDGAGVLRIGGRRAVMKRASTLRPNLEKARISEVGFLEGCHRGLEVWSTVEDSVYVLGPPRSGKGYYVVINRILNAPGAVVTTSTRPDNLAVTMKARATKNRPVVVFDPEGLAPGIEGGIKWSPVRGCEEARTAAVRAKGFVAAGFVATGENRMWQDIAASILRCLLHAAALEWLGARELHSWATNPAKARDAVDILMRHPGAALGWGDELQAALDQDERTRDNSWLGVRQALSGLSDPQVLEAVTPRPGEGLDPQDLLRRKGTLYMIGTSDGAAASAALITALVEDMVNVAKRLAATSTGARLDPPLSLILDEAANYPVPSLPSLMSEGGGSGIATVAVFQSVGQPRKVYGVDQADAVWDAATVKLILGGAGKRETLEDISILVGERDEYTTAFTQQSRLALSPLSVQDSIRRVRILPPDEVRLLPQGMALLMLRSAPLVFIDMTPWTARKDAKTLHADAKAVTAQITGT